MTNRSTRARPLPAAMLGVALIAGAIFGSGCAGQAGTHGRDDSITAIYAATTLTADMPDRLRVPAVIAAAETTLRKDGFSIETSTSTEEKGRVVAVPPEAGLLERVVVKAEVGRMGTRVQVRIDPLGDEPRSRKILDGILGRVGR